jgi:hypothetical protein
VKDCGCFGDALKLTNWQTFYKNLIALPFSWYIYQKRDKWQLPKGWKAGLVTLYPILIIGWVSFHGITHLPLLDFRPYSIGTNITEAMSIPEGAPMPEYSTTFILEKNEQRKEFTEHNYPYDDTTWVFIDSQSKLIKSGYQPPIESFNLENEQGEDISQELLQSSDPVFILIAPRIDQLSIDNLNPMIELKSECQKKDIAFYCATSSLLEQAYQFDNQHQAAFNYLLADGTMLKTIIRGNPGLIILQHGTILGKYHHNHLPDLSITNNALAYCLKEQARTGAIKSIALLLIISLGAFVLNYSKKP